MSELYLVPLVMFGCLAIVIIVGIPIAFATGSIGLVCAYLLWGPNSVYVLMGSVGSVMKNFILLAVPFFTFMAIVLDKTAVVEDIYDAMYKWSGPLRGGLGIATVLVGTVMAAMTGVAAGAVTALGVIALPQMLKYGYSRDMAIGPVLAGGTLGQLIPPSVVMIIYGAMTGTSIGKLFAGGITCGLLLSALYCAFILVMSCLNETSCPALPNEDRASWKDKVVSLKGIILPIALIVAVLGAIFSGIATPTEGAAVGCIGAILCALIRRRLCWSAIRESSLQTLRITSFVAWITIGALCFGSVFNAVGGNKMILQVVSMLPFGKWGMLILMMLVLLFLGMFLDTMAIIVICAPLFLPSILEFGIDPLWFGLLFMVNLQAAYLTPPFGYSLFYVKAVAPKGVTLAHIYRAALPFVGLQILGLALIMVFPPIAVWLPNTLMK